MNAVRKNIAATLLASLACAACLAPPASEAAGLLIADGGFGGVLEIKEHNVKVNINNGVAVTTVTQVFQNTESRQVEALYTFPVPRGASVANFTMWIGGKEMVGEVLEKKRAREIYDSYKRVQRDPGLLEQNDFKSFEMRIFPIAAKAEQKVQICYYQELEYDHDWATYIYPLATTTQARIDQATKGRFAVTVDVKSAVPLAALESPSHSSDFVFARHGENYTQASLELKEGSLAKDVVIAQRLSRPKTGVDLLTSAQAGQDGFFTLLFSAGEELAKAEAGSDYLFLLDVSGSMRDDGKLLVSKDCLGAFVEELSEADRLEIITFNLQPNLAFGEKRTADRANKQAALDFLAAARANGGTVLNPALTTAYKYADPDRPLNIVILSDGLTEQNDRTSLLQLVEQRPRNAVVFCVGVGNDVNKPLLEQMAQDSGGLASFLSRGDDFKRQAKAFRRKLMNPVAKDVRMEFAGLDIFDLEPREIPNLYHGSPVRVYGRYRGEGKATLKLRASINGKAWEEATELNFPKSDAANPEIDRMWAWKRIQTLLNHGDKAGTRDSVIPEVVRLGEQFSIVTEYTSFLVLENDAEYQRWKIQRRNLDRFSRERQSQGDRERQLAELRQRALDQLGPQDSASRPAQPLQFASAQPAGSPSVTSPAAPEAQPSPAIPAQSRDLSLPGSRSSSSSSSGGGGGGGGGSGPVGPLFVAFTAWLARLRKRSQEQGQ